MKLPRVVFAFIMSAFGLASQLLATPTINTHPVSQTIALGSGTSFTVAATAGNGSLLYQWQGSTDSGTTWGPLSNTPPFGGVTTATLSVGGPKYSLSGGMLRCVVTDGDGPASPANSDPATLTIVSPSPVLILAHPVSKPAFQGDVGTTFEILATGTSLTYQWQISTDNGATFSNIIAGAPYAGDTTATLSIADPYTAFSGATYNNSSPYRYRCRVTSGIYTFTSRSASLSLFATPTNTATVTTLVNATPASTIEASLANQSTPITVRVSGIPSGGAVRIFRYADLNGDATIGLGEPLVQSFFVTDGAVTSFGGVVDPNIAGDTDPGDPGVIDPTAGTINATFTLAKAAEMGRGAGNYIFRVVSTSGAFKPVDSSVFTITPATLAYTVSGTVNVPYAQVALLQQTGTDQEYFCGTVADGSGIFTLPANSGSYMVMALAAGYVTNMGSAPMPTVTTANITGANVTLTAAEHMNLVTLADQATQSGLRGVQIFFESDNGYMTIGNTDSNGVAVAASLASANWEADISGLSLEAIGYVRPQTDGGIPLNTTVQGIGLRAANAMIYGTLTDNSATPVPLENVSIRAGDQSNTWSMDTYTDATGHYYLAVYGTGIDWYVNADSQNPLFGTSYSLPPSQSATVLASTAYERNLVAPVVTAHLSGTVTNSDNAGAPVVGVQLNLYQALGMNTNYVTTVTTDGSGAFSFGVSAGSYQIALETQSASLNNVLGPVLSYPTVTDGNDVTGIPFVVRTTTGTISGTVTDFNGAPMVNANVVASATIDTVNYTAGAQTNVSGQYSFPVINGDWTVNVYSNFVTPPQTITVSGTPPTSTTLNFSPSVFFSGPNDQSGIIAGSSAYFNANVNYNGISSVTTQWEVSTDSGSTWNDVLEVSPYSGVATTNLNINPSSLDLDGNQYRLAVDFTYNTQPHTEYSNVATLTVTGSAPSVLGQPSSQTITASGGTSFGFSVDGTPAPTYQWQYSLDNGSTFSPLGDGGYFSGTQTNTLVVNNADTTISGWQFNCIATNGVGSDAVSDSVTLTVNAQSQTVTFNGQTLTKDLATTLSATATSGLTNFNFTALGATTTYTLDGNMLTITGVGDVTVRATQPGDPYYASASANATFTVNKLPATVNLSNLTVTYDGNPKSASATTSPEGLSVSFTYDGSGTPPTDAGPYTVVGTINDATYQGSSTGTFTINKADQSINFTNPGTQTYSATPITLSATGGASGNPVTFSYISGPATLSGTNNSTLTMTGTGMVTIRASQLGNANYNAAPDVDQTFEVTAAATGFEAWRNAKFTVGELADLNLSGPNAVYGQDGLPNLVKYALGLEPKQNITAGLPTTSTTATDWVYTYQRPDSSAGITDVTYTVEYSTDLTTWTPLTDAFVSNAGGYDTRQATYALASATKIYFRLNITQP